jgi:carboxylesterase type B
MSPQRLSAVRPLRSTLMALLVALSTDVAWTPNATAATVIATTDNGSVEGLVAPTVHKFLGIPYAAPPVGSLRWQPPQPHASWANPLDATAFANHCPQVVSPFGFPSTTEDCLYASPGLALSAMATDAAFVCNARTADRLLSRKPTFAYEFNDTNAPQLFLPVVNFPYGAAHASELQYLFNVPDVLPVPAPPLDADQQQLSATMIRYWTRFARSGKPHASHVPRWPKYNANDAVFLSLVAPTPVLEGRGAFSVDHKCGFSDPILGNN